jgi:hypothetical protein
VAVAHPFAVEQPRAAERHHHVTSSP